MRDFMVLHYYRLSQRAHNPSWRYWGSMALPDGLPERIEAYPHVGRWDALAPSGAVATAEPR